MRRALRDLVGVFGSEYDAPTPATVDTERFTVRVGEQDMFSRLRDKPTLVQRVGGVVVEEHWLTGPVDAPVYADFTSSRLYSAKLYSASCVTTLALSGSVRAPRYAQPDDAASKICTFTDTDETVLHFLVGRRDVGKYARTSGSPYTLIINSDGTHALTVVQRETAPFVMILRTDLASLVQSNHQSFWLFGNLDTPVCLKSLDTLQYRHDNTADDRGGFAAIIEDYAVFAAGSWESAYFKRPRDLPTWVHVSTQARIWLDGGFNRGVTSAVYWRHGTGPTEIGSRGELLYRRGKFPFYARSDSKPLPDRIDAIVQHATYQLTGTCYLNAAVNALVCTPCLRNACAAQLSLPPQPGLLYDQAAKLLLHGLVCEHRAQSRPIKQSNAICRLEKVTFGKRSNGGDPFAASLVLLDALQLRWAWLSVSAPVRAFPIGTDVGIIVTGAMADLPRELHDAEGNRCTLVAALILYTEARGGHAVTGLMDALNNPRIILDSNGSIDDAQWWPTIESSRFAAFENLGAFGLYASDRIVRLRPVRCASAPPALLYDRVIGNTRLARLNAAITQCGNDLKKLTIAPFAQHTL